MSCESHGEDGTVAFEHVFAVGDVAGEPMLAHEASAEGEVAAEAIAVEIGATLAGIAGTVHTHPTLSEAVMGAAKNALGRAIHTLNR